MFGFTAKITKKRAAIALAALLVPILIAVSISAARKNDDKPNMTRIGESAEERISFLGQFGWECEPESETEKDTVIPAEFDDVYEPYNKIQLAQGFDLSPFKGKSVKLYNIKILNYPENSEFVYASLLVSDGIIIGGDIHSTALDGFMHGFNLSGTGLNYGQSTSSGG